MLLQKTQQLMRCARIAGLLSASRRFLAGDVSGQGASCLEKLRGTAVQKSSGHQAVGQDELEKEIDEILSGSTVKEWHRCNEPSPISIKEIDWEVSEKGVNLFTLPIGSLVRLSQYHTIYIIKKVDPVNIKIWRNTMYGAYFGDFTNLIPLEDSPSHVPGIIEPDVTYGFPYFILGKNGRMVKNNLNWIDSFHGYQISVSKRKYPEPIKI